MESLNFRVIDAVADWLAADESCWLATVVRTYGSSPRPVGSLLAFNCNKGSVGSLSGGCIEEDLLASLATEQPLQAILPRKLRYGTTEEERVRYALPCGGELHIILEYLAPTQAKIEHFQFLRESLLQRKPAVRTVNLLDGEVDVNIGGIAAFNCTDTMLQHPLNPSYRVLLIGVGEVAHYVAQFALAVDFDVTLCDPRESFLRNWTLTDVLVEQRLPDDLIRERFSDKNCAILALAHDPRIDDMALLEALTTDAFYIGAMGSEKTSAARRERLFELGLQPQQIARLHAPIGFAIGSKTPAEIAIAIVAHLVSVRNQHSVTACSDQDNQALQLESRKGCAIAIKNAANS